MHRSFILTCSICLLVVSSAFGHPGHDHHDEDATKSVRTWKDATGIFEVQATFVMAKDGNVQLRKKDSTLITLPIERLGKEDQAWITRRLAEIEKLNTQFRAQLVAAKQPAQDDREKKAPAIQKHFQPFADKLKTRWDDHYFYVESNGMPDHNMMVGITAWQQQVPLPQPYTGDNAWRIPLHPVPAKKPMSAKTNFFRGAIALAVNGVPIFNPIKNDGRTDTLLAGELDQWGGHCGRADDYHYHIAPVHLETKVGKGNPVGYALDGYPIYGYQDPKADDYAPLDWLNGHKGSDGRYHYHATKTYPYLNGGFYGEVVERDGQVNPQPRAGGVRPALPGLRGAKITGFENPKPGSYIVRYDVFGDKRSVEYTVARNGSATFNFVSQEGTTRETYTPRQRGSGGGGGRRNAEPPPAQDRPPRGDQADGGRRQGGGGDPIARALDTNRDGTISIDELKNAQATLRSLDRNKDGKIDRDELRRPGGNRDPQAGGPRGPQPGDGPRQPWILVHAKEIDLNEDGIISRDEIVGEATRSFTGYDKNDDGKLTEAEYTSRTANVRSAMGGFIRGHAKELDRNNDDILSKQEVFGNAERMFAKVDRDGDGKITSTELGASRRK